VRLIDGRYYAFEDYSDDLLRERLAYWQSIPSGESDFGIVASLQKEIDRRVDEHLLAWVESK